MTFDEADFKIKALKGPFAHVTDRASDPEKYGYVPGRVLPRFYVGWSPCFGNGNTWDEAFANLKRNRDHWMSESWRVPRRTYIHAWARAPKDVLLRRFS